MDRQSLIGIVIITILVVVWMWLNTPPQHPPVQTVKKEQARDTVPAVAPVRAPEPKTAEPAEPYGKYFSARAAGTERIITIETDIYTAEFSTKGGLLRKWELKQYKTWDGAPVQLVDNAGRGDLTALLTTTDGRVINTRDLYFDASPVGSTVQLEGKFEFEINFTLPSANGGSLVKTVRFRDGEYGFTEDIRMQNLADVVANYQYEIAWEHGLRYAEHNSVDESSFAAAYAYTAGELTDIDATKGDEKVQKELSGGISWVATRNKYFAVALLPESPVPDGAYLEGIRTAAPDNGVVEKYTISLKMPYRDNASEKSTVRVFLGPLEHSVLKSYGKGLESIMSLGWAWLIRPISEYLMLPVFTAIHYVVPNWGVVIIIFSILIKIALHPLSKSQMKSMKKMQKLQPMMEELREKYKDDPQKQQHAIMNLYKEYGVNPAGGCLPLLLQLPIMYALYAVFRGAIQLRQAAFVGWITDLSVPDVIYHLPTKLPLLNLQDISGIALLMGISMFIQQKMTVKDPRQKAMVWMMPVMMTLLFNGFPSGLNLYYAVFNVLAIGQQLLINRQDDEEPLRKVEQKKKSGGGIFKFAKDIPRLKK